MSKITLIKGFQDEAIQSAFELFLYTKNLLDSAGSNPGSRATAINHNGYLLIEAPTGSGKTLMAGKIVERFSAEEKIVWFWFAPFKGVVGQTYSTLKTQFAGVRLRQLQDDRSPSNSKAGDVFVTTWQAVATSSADSRKARQDGELNPSVDGLISGLRGQGFRIGVVVDEAHHNFSDTTLAATFFHEVLDPDYTILITATPDDKEIEALRLRLQVAELHRISVSRSDVVKVGLIKEGVRCVSYMVEAGKENLFDLEKTALRDATFLHREIKATLEKENSTVVPLMLVQVDSSPDSVKRAREYLIALGFKAEQIATHTSKEPDANILSLANDENFEVLIFKMAVALGFDAPRAFSLVSMRASRDSDFGVQLVGRILRVERRLQLAAKDNTLPAILRYGYVFLTELESQSGIEEAGKRINAVQTQYATVSPTTVVVRLGEQTMVQALGEGGQTSIFPEPAPPFVTHTEGAENPYSEDDFKLERQIAASFFDSFDISGSASAKNTLTGKPKVVLPQKYPLRDEAPKSFKMQIAGDPDITEEECANAFTVSVRELLDAKSGEGVLTRKTVDIFVEDLQLHLSFKAENIKYDPEHAALAAQRALTKSDMFDPRQLQRALLERLQGLLTESGIEGAENPEKATLILNTILSTRPDLLDSARTHSLHKSAVIVQAENLPDEIVSQQHLEGSRFNIYGVIPDNIGSSWEREFVNRLDSDEHGIVLWWHRNPDRQPYSVSVLLSTGRPFYPDFVIGVHGRRTELNALLADPKQQFDTYKETPKSDAVHAIYGKVLILHIDDNKRWRTVRFDPTDPRPVLGAEFSLATLTGWPVP